MTRDQLRKHWTIIEAYKNGAEVEFRRYDSETWKHASEPNFDDQLQYRIAPRDWDWACRMMIDGKRITANGIGVLGIGDHGIVMYFASGSPPKPATIERLHLLATDYRVVEDSNTP